MLWLIVHDWFLLCLAFGLGLLIGWWIWHDQAKAVGNNVGDFDAAVISANAVTAAMSDMQGVKPALAKAKTARKATPIIC